jgi:hypothetical protein
MDWQQISGLCQTQLERFRAELPPVASFFPKPESIAPMLLAYERDTNEKIEVAVRQFSADRTWPALSSMEGMMLCFRLEFAASVAFLLSEQPRPWADDEETDCEHRLQWLMLFAWNEEGCPTLHETLGRLILPLKA